MSPIESDTAPAKVAAPVGVSSNTGVENVLPPTVVDGISPMFPFAA